MKDGDENVNLLFSTTMDHPKCLSSLFTTLFAISLVFGTANGFGGVMRVHRRFVGNHRHLEELKQHDARRHAARLLRSINVIDAPMGGLTIPAGLYYTHLAIGTPPKNYTVHVDTGSDLLWVYCQECIGCPTDDDARGIHLMPYNPKSSKTAKIVRGGKGYCQDLGPNRKDGPCPFEISYGDGTEVSGYWVRDFLTYNKVSGDHKSKPARQKITLGCASRFSDPKNISGAAIESGLEGLIGFGFNNMSMISQLADSGIVRREFAHCLDPVKGGGIFAIGHVVKPEVKMVQFDPKSSYSLIVKSVDIGGKVADFKAMGVAESERWSLIDSGTTMCIVPEALYNFVIKEIFSNKPNLNGYQKHGLWMFNQSGSLDLTGFPPVNFLLTDQYNTEEATLTVHPRDYVTRDDDDDDVWVIILQGSPPGAQYGFVFGDVALGNKLVIYDGENNKIGWTEHDCSSSIEVEDGDGRVCAVGAHSESSPT